MHDELGEIVGVGVHVVAVEGFDERPWPRRSWAMARYPLCQLLHLVLEGIGGQRPAVTEHDRPSFALIRVVDLGSVLGGDVRHDQLLESVGGDEQTV